MANKIFASTPVIVMWLEPRRDRGKKSIIKAKEIVKPHRSKLRPGLTALINWKSSGRVYKAIIKSIRGLQVDQTSAKNANTNDEQPLAAVRGSRLALVPAFITEETPTHVDQTAAKDISSEQPAVVLVTSHVTEDSIPALNGVAPNRVENQSELYHQIRRDIKDLKTEVSGVKNEMGEMKTELSQMLSTYNANFQRQLGSIFEAIKQQTESLTNLVTNKINCKPSVTSPRIQRLAGTAEAPSTPRRDSRNLTPLYGVLEGDDVKIEVDEEISILVGKTIYENYFTTSYSATSFLRKLMCHFFTEEEMLTGNFEGGEVVTATGRVHMEQLNPSRRKALLRQVELEFSGSTKTQEAYAKLKAAINDRCRSERRKYN